MRHVTSSLLAAAVLSFAVPVSPLAGATPIAPVPEFAASRLATVQVRVTPDRRDWTYQPGEKVTFRVNITADNEPVQNVPLEYTVGPEMMPAEKEKATASEGELVIEGGTMNQPGFLRCVVTAEVNGRNWRGLATVGFAPEKIQPTQTNPEDFDAFWQAGKEALADVPMDARLTLLPERCTSEVNVYHVNFRVLGEPWGHPARFFGIYSEPKAPGKYPAILKVPGAGVRPYPGDPGLSARGALVLEVGIHGIPVTMEQPVYDALYGGAIKGYWTFNSDNRDTYYYRRVYLGCVRANDFLTSRENWNGQDLLVMGASQGGQLSIVTAALDERVTALAATHPAGCDWTGYLHGRAGGWPHPFKPNEDGSPSVHHTPAKLKALSYYDVVNFARRLKVPGHYVWGYNDEVCPPTSMFAAYNAITAPKELHLLLEVGHAYPSAQGDEIYRWVAEKLRLK